MKWVTCLVVLWWACGAVAENLFDPFVVHLGNESASVTVEVLPRGLRDRLDPRFDEVARVASVRLDGHEYLGWPGLVDEFGQLGEGALGFDEAGPGDPFIKIGVGWLERLDADFYMFNHDYPVRRLLGVEVLERSPNELTALQSCPPLRGYAYRYTKTYRFDSEHMRLTISYRLTNTGSRAFSFEHYNHNWFGFDDHPVDRNTYLHTGFEIPALPYPWMTRCGPRIHLDSARPPSFFLPSFDPVAAERAWVRVGHTITGQGVMVESDTPLSRFALYMTPDSICPELFVRHHVDPGDDVAWQLRYRFTPPHSPTPASE